MNTDQASSRLAQPAEEEIKNHGDQLGQPVKQVVTGTESPDTQEKSSDQAQNK